MRNFNVFNSVGEMLGTIWARDAWDALKRARCSGMKEAEYVQERDLDAPQRENRIQKDSDEQAGWIHACT
jgi:hypothetical protein